MRLGKRAAGVLAVAAVGVGLALPAGAGAKISTSCFTPNGNNEPPGQQDVCTGGGLDQGDFVNPTGFAPPGQNK